MSRRFSTFELLLLGMFAALIVAANLALRFPIKVPGHSGLVWMALLVVARCVVPRAGAGAAVGLLSGLLAAFLGMGDKGALDTFLSYMAPGVGVDLVAALPGRPEGALRCAAAGAVGHLAKLGVKIALALWIGIPTGFIFVGQAYPAVTYAAFGLAGGYLGWLVLRALRGAGFFAYLAEKR
jgi:hypothetical protein